MNAGLDRPRVSETPLRMDPISSERYISRDYARQEWTHMWMRTWHIAGMAMVPQLEGRRYTPSPAGGPDLVVKDAPLEVIRYREETLGTTSDQDLSIAAIQQVMRSAGFVHHNLCNQERRVQNFHERLNAYMTGPVGPT
jgi:Ring hydroxylating alpha subunit (catalytic domain)